MRSPAPLSFMSCTQIHLFKSHTLLACARRETTSRLLLLRIGRRVHSNHTPPCVPVLFAQVKVVDMGGMCRHFCLLLLGVVHTTICLLDNYAPSKSLRVIGMGKRAPQVWLWRKLLLYASRVVLSDWFYGVVIGLVLFVKFWRG